MSRLKRQDKEVPSVKEEFEEHLESDGSNTKIPIDKANVVSTGCTLLDLSILGGRIKGGGIPGGIMAEIAGGSGSGKTALMMDIAASVQAKGGETMICDPEGRLDRDYASTFGCEIPKDNYHRPNIVLDHKNDRGKVIEQGIEGLFHNWEPENPNVMNMFGADSIAALSTAMEMETGDKRGQRKPKELSEFCRVMARIIAEDHKLLVFTNQLRVGGTSPMGRPTDVTTGGKAVPFYSSLRVRSTQIKKISRTKTNKHKVKITKDVGIITQLSLVKNSLDDPYRKCNMYLMFGHGISDVMGNLNYIKEITKASNYDVLDKTYVGIHDAVSYIEGHNLEGELREWVIELWEENENLFRVKRKPKVRF